MPSGARSTRSTSKRGPAGSAVPRPLAYPLLLRLVARDRFAQVLFVIGAGRRPVEIHQAPLLTRHRQRVADDVTDGAIAVDRLPILDRLFIGQQVAPAT